MHTFWKTGEQTTINEVLTHAVSKYRDNIYLDFAGDTTYTFGDVFDASRSFAVGLSQLGVKRGDTVASILDNSIDAVVCWYAINMLGAVSVPINTAYKGEFLRHQLEDSGASIVVSEADYADRIYDLGQTAQKKMTVITRAEPKSKTPSGINHALMDSVKTAPKDFEICKVNPGDLSMLIYTSGTTGPSKGCMVSHNYACNLAGQSIRSKNLFQEDIHWTALPLFHLNATATSVLKCAILGSRCAVYPRFSLSGFWPDMERSGATVLSLLGSMAPLIGNAPDNEHSKRCFGQVRIVSTAPFTPDLQQSWKDRFGVKDCIVPGYGLSEAAMVVLQTPDRPSKNGASGVRNEDFEVIIADEKDNELPAETPGEILIRPKKPHIMFEGYWNRPEATQKVLRNLWFHSGDIGKFDEDGYFYFLDRKKDYLRRRGENISSFEMEKAFLSHPAIHDVAVHAVFSNLGEDDVKVTAVLKENADLTPQTLCEWCLDKVPYFAVPRYIEFRDDLPRNPTGKVLKYQLREDGCTPDTWDREKSDFNLAKR